MSWKFNPPPGWPQQPEGWVPPPGWTPDPSWPPPPAGWQFWVPADSPQSAPPPQAGSPLPAAGSPAGLPPTTAAPPPGVAASAPFTSTPGAPASGTPAPGGMPMPAGTPVGGAPPPGGAGGYYPPQGGGAPAASKPWFGRWWAILGLIGLLVVGAAVGYGGTRYALDQSSETEEPASAGNPVPTPTEEVGSPDATESPDVALPTVPPIETASPGDVTGTCGEVAVIMVGLITDTREAEDLDQLAEARRTAADDVRELEDGAADEQEREAVVTLADELDGSAEMVEDNPDEATFDDSFDRVATAYSDFNEEAC